MSCKYGDAGKETDASVLNVSTALKIGVITNYLLIDRSAHEKMISKDLLSNVNEAGKSANKYGAAYQKEQDAIPLKVL